MKGRLRSSISRRGKANAILKKKHMSAKKIPFLGIYFKNIVQCSQSKNIRKYEASRQKSTQGALRHKCADRCMVAGVGIGIVTRQLEKSEGCTNSISESKLRFA